MLLSDRRRTLIFLCMAGMEAAWIAPFVLLFFRGASPLVTYGLLLIGLLLWILVLELLGRSDLASPFYEIIAFGVMLVLGLLLVRLLLYRSYPLGDLTWMRQAVADLFNSPGRVAPALALFLTNVFLWHRATTATGREISFFNVSMSFRRGLLLLIAGAGLYSTLRGQSPLVLLWLYLGFGLTAVALARIDDKARGAQSAGTPLPMRRMAQLALAVGVTVGAIALLSRLYTRSGLMALLRLLEPVWRLVQPILAALAGFLAQLLDPFFRWFEGLMRSLLAGRDLAPLFAPGIQTPAPGQEALSSDLPYWLTDLLPRILLITCGAVMLVVGVAFLFLWLERSRAGRSAMEAEEEAVERWSPEAGFIKRAAGLVGRFGVSRQMLAAISVENIYANVCRLARRRGFGRKPAQSPDDYLPMLALAFVGHDEALARITAAYMNVHYGDHPVTADQLAALRKDYRALRESEQA